MSASSPARNSSKLTSGAVCESGIVSPLCSAPGSPGVPGIDLDRHVLQLRLGAQQHRRVAVDERAYFGVTFIVTIATPLCRSHARDFADLRAGDRDRLALPGRHRLGGLEFGLEREVVAPEHRHPAGQLEILVREDVAADERPRSRSSSTTAMNAVR